MVSPYNIFLAKRQVPKGKENRLPGPSMLEDLNNEGKLVYEIRSEDGYHAKGTNLEGK